MLGLRYGTVQVVPHRLEWAQALLEERGRRYDALQGVACEIEHVGSTAVPGISAKPILDIAVGLSAAIPLGTIVTALARVGYEYRGDAGDEGGHIFVHQSAPLIRTHHIDVVELGGPQWKAYLELRDFLRWSGEARDAYTAEKLALADRHGEDRKAYTEAKDAIPRHLLAEARRPMELTAHPFCGLRERLRLSRRRALAQQSPEAPGIHDAKRRPGGDLEQVTVSSHQHIGTPRDRAGQDPAVVRVSHFKV